MNLFTGKDKDRQNVVGAIRQSQIITTFGPGAVVSLRDGSFLILGTETWKKPEATVIHENNLTRLTGAKAFYPPPVSKSSSFLRTPQGNLPVRRFPEFYFCPKCRSLMRWQDYGMASGQKALYCPTCKSKLLPSRFMVACVNGHIDDFPYDWWVHHGKEKEEGIPHHLSVHFQNQASGFEGIVIECSCGAKRNMAGCMTQDALKDFPCTGRLLWQKDVGQEECKARPHTILRSSASIYYADTASALTLPHTDEPICSVLEERQSIIQNVLGNLPEEQKKNVLFSLVQDQLRDVPTDAQHVWQVWQGMDGENAQAEFTEQSLLEEEYSVLSQGTLKDDGDSHYFAQEVSVPAALKPVAAQVVALKSLREVIALRGFRRLYPQTPKQGEPRDYHFAGWKGYPRRWPGKYYGKPDWLPAVELLGEGIFIRFNEPKIADWEKGIGNRYAKLKENAAEMDVQGKDTARPRYILLHTLAHLLIRQAAMSCGYSSASLKERIYSTYPDGAPMAGILLYTSSSDSDGSLGGLVRLAAPERLGKLIEEMTQAAQWCSADPICAESRGQGYHSLNLAACHACTLLPETSCEARNCFLDRAAVIGQLDDGSKGFLSYLLLN